MGRNNLAHRTGDAINAVLAAAGYNFHLLLKWLQLLLQIPGGSKLLRPSFNGSERQKTTGRAVRAGLRATGSFLPPRSPPTSGPISLDTRCAPTAKTILVVRLLPGTEFIDGQRVAAARLLERKQTTANRGNNLGFTTRHPTFCSRWWQIGDRQR